MCDSFVRTLKELPFNPWVYSINLPKQAREDALYISGIAAAIGRPAIGWIANPLTVCVSSKMLDKTCDRIVIRKAVC